MRFRLFVTAVFVFSMAVVGQADYVTPGLGTVYTLGDLAQIATDVVKQETDYNYRILDKLVISPSDELQISGSIVTMATRYLTVGEYGGTLSAMPIIEVQGRVQASNSIFRGDETSEFYTSPYGLMIHATQDGQPSGVIQDCTFEKLFTGVTARNPGLVNITGCRFNECFQVGVNVFNDCTVRILGCTFYKSNPLSGLGTIQMKNCRSEGGGVILSGLADGSEFSDNIFIGPGYTGIYIDGRIATPIEKCQVSGFKYGIIAAGSSEVRIERNSVWGNEYGALWFTDYADARVRRNQIVHNTAEILSADGAESMPAISIDDDATPDLGTVSSPGFNIIKHNGPWALYHHGTQDIQAIGNAWDSANPAVIEAMVYHKPDDGGDADGNGVLSGEVHFTPFSRIPDTPGNTDVDWSGRIDFNDLLLIQQNWHQIEE